MAEIPSVINGVSVAFGPGVVNDVHERVVQGLIHCVKPTLANGATLNSIYISSVFDSHTTPSRHMQKKAIDLSRINGVKIALGYPSGGAIKAIVDAIQTRFESFAYRRENYGPYLKRKLGQAHWVANHHDHIHLSVN
jgi:hypothetical protein